MSIPDAAFRIICSVISLAVWKQIGKCTKTGKKGFFHDGSHLTKQELFNISYTVLEK